MFAYGGNLMRSVIPKESTRQKANLLVMTQRWRSLLIIGVIVSSIPLRGNTAPGPLELMDAPRRQLAGTNVLAASSSIEALPISISRSISFRFRPRDLFRPGAIIDIIGPGRVVGLILTADPPINPMPVFAAFKVRECVEPGCSTEMNEMRVSYPFGPHPKVTVRPGNYRLYVVADGEPVRGVLRIPGLTGRANLDSRPNGAVDIATPESTIASESGPSLYEASHTYTIRSQRGLAFSTTWVRGHRYQGSRIKYCFSD